MKQRASIYASTHPVSRSEAARHLAVSKPVADVYLHEISCRVLPGDRVDLIDLWRRMWGIDQIPIAMLPKMQAPLLTIEQVAELVGMTSHTIRRAGNSHSTKWNLPRHVDLGPRARRYLPMHVMAWINRSPVDHWLERRHGPKGPFGLTRKSVESVIGGEA